MDIKITVLKINRNIDLINEYLNPIFNDSCIMKENMTFISHNGIMPENFCNSAWYDLKPYIDSLNKNIELYPGWMKNKNQAVVSCNDGLHPVIFLLEVI